MLSQPALTHANWLWARHVTGVVEDANLGYSGAGSACDWCGMERGIANSMLWLLWYDAEGVVGFQIGFHSLEGSGHVYF